MSNKYIELVKKYLADPESVSKEELEANYAAAVAAAYAAYEARAGRDAEAEYWVKEYEKLNGKLQDAKKEK